MMEIFTVLQTCLISLPINSPFYPGQYQGFFCHTKSTIRNTFAYPALDNFLVMTKFLEGVSTPELTQLKSKDFLPDYKLPLGENP